MDCIAKQQKAPVRRLGLFFSSREQAKAELAFPDSLSGMDGYEARAGAA